MTQTSSRSARLISGLPVQLFKALADPTRIALVAWLTWQRKPKTVTEIAESGCCAVDLSVVSRHLAILRSGGVLESERRGREVYYWVAVAPLAGVLRQMADLLEFCCAPTRKD